MKIYKLSQNNKQLVYIFSLDRVINNIETIKRINANLISIRDNPAGLSNKVKLQYELIDNSGIQNIYVATFDDVELPFENKKGIIFPDENIVSNILTWAKSKWEENHKIFVVHCTAGISRSSAIAILINQTIQGQYKNIYNPAIHSPNKKVLEFGDQLNGTNIKEQITKEEKEFDAKNLN